MNYQLGRLEKVDLRRVWFNEAGDFTPWLAQEENLKLLGDAIGLDLELEAIEEHVGPFRADILCKDTASDNWVLVENQLEQTDHSHLGQLLTYAAGLDAVTIVWIAARFREEHRAALDWLNEATSENINFFGLEIELWQIGNSHVAPKFNIKSQPNDWTKTLQVTRQSGGQTERGAFYLEYWQAFFEYLREHSSFIKSRKPQPGHWMDYPLGRSNLYLSSIAGGRDKYLRVEFVLAHSEAKAYFNLLIQDKIRIEQEIGESLEWREQPNKKYSAISLTIEADPKDSSQWEAQHEWLMEKLELFHRCFAPRVKNLRIPDDFSEGGLGS